MSLKELSLKLLTLLAILTAHRLQTYSLILLENIEISKDKVIIKIPDRIKSSGFNKYQPILRFPFYDKNPKICAARALCAYIDRTKDLRKSDSKLFISFKKPHINVTSQTLSRWISIIFTEAGLDTNMFSAHSTRSASTSLAKRRGIPIDLIRKTAGWSKDSCTFARHYDRSALEIVDENYFANAIYNTL